MPTNVHEWSITAADNATADSAVNWAENQTPGSVNGSARAEMAAVARFLKDINGTVSTGGSANAYTATPNTNHTAFVNGLIIGIKASFTNTGACTLNFNSLGAKKILTVDGECAPGQITSGARYRLSYDTALDGGSGAWFLFNPSAAAGLLIPYAGATVPPGHAFPYGQAISRTTYPGLFQALGTTHGSGDGATTFNMPDLRGRAPFGKDDMGGSAASRLTTAASGVDGLTLGAVGGAQTHTLATSEIPSHTHTFSGTTGTEGAHTHGGTSDAGGSHQHNFSGGTNNGGVDHNHPGPRPSDTNANACVSGGGGTFGGGFFRNISATDTGAASQYLHTHTFSGTTDAGGTHAHTFTTGAGSAHSHSFSGTTASTGGGGAHNNMPPAIVCNYIMRLC